MRRFFDSPQDLLKYIRATVGRVVVDISYGRDVKDYIDYAEYVHEVFGPTAKPFAFLVDFLPLCEYGVMSRFYAHQGLIVCGSKACTTDADGRNTRVISQLLHAIS